MHTLVLGIDGGDERIIQNMEMPFLNGKIQEGTSYDVTEDLWSRGWASILNGLHGRETGAFYCKPALDGQYGFTQSFGTLGHEEAPTKPLWEIANNNGYSVGFMNPPTTVPAPEVEGFFVSGAGGGHDPAGGIPKEACYPVEVLDTLNNFNCSWETRFTAAGIYDKEAFFNQIRDTIKSRTDAYLELCENYSPDFGFFVHKELVVIQNLLMYEIESIIDGDSSPNQLQKSINDLFNYVDGELSRLVSQLNPDEVIIVSDHGQSPYQYTVNLNSFLKDIGMQSGSGSGLSKSILRSAGQSLLPNKLEHFVKSQFPGAVEKIAKPNVDWEESNAFTFRYIPGIYINDQVRFNGPIPNSKTKEIADSIINKFNNKLAKEYGLCAKEYRKKYMDAHKETILPDIWINNPDNIFFEAHGDFIRENHRYGHINDFAEIDQDFFTGVKGHKPILISESNLGGSGDRALTLAYDIIKNRLEMGK